VPRIVTAGQAVSNSLVGADTSVRSLNEQRRRRLAR
jgi:hypothetical protein